MRGPEINATNLPVGNDNIDVLYGNDSLQVNVDHESGHSERVELSVVNGRLTLKVFRVFTNEELLSFPLGPDPEPEGE